ncbi:GNAT family N-acetyltransferase [Dyella choica]|uniref:N-acetyltransferase n=1 Tax=Dyella choica TaxID=1927959 RepID=A0A432M7B4_9GAMM|nr:GNAT family N-acetyltransferase [Dyella choica]RUL76793.1 N-acetyltransferase [Dyella choica]
MLRACPDRDFQVEPGRPRDIFFFISEVVSGAWRQHFGTQFCSLPMTERQYGARCAKAILAHLLPSWRAATTTHFVVVRHRREVVGAALYSTSASLTSIEVVVVDERWRRQGVGRALVTYFQRHTPAGGSLECYCTTKSQVMVRLLKQLGFVRTHKSVECTIANGQRIHAPERWEWQAHYAPLARMQLNAGIQDKQTKAQASAHAA